MVECDNCNLVYVNPRPTFDEMAHFYPVDYHDGREDTQHLQRYTKKFGLNLQSIEYDERFWDGSGRGTFRHAFIRLARVKWKDLRDKKLSLMQKVALKIGSVLDKLIFFYKWGERFWRSGIIVVTMSKD